MASINTGRVNNVDQNGSDDIRCSYYAQDNHHERNSKDFDSTQMSKTSMFPDASYNNPEESSLNHDMLYAVENTMKRSTDNMMRFLEGISSRLSQLELYCYNIDKSVGQMSSSFDRDHEEADLKLKSIQKELQEVHRSVQVLRDKQELAETQKELAKLQLAQRESSTNSSVQQDEETATPREAKTGDHSPHKNVQPLALALPHPVSPQPSHPSESMSQTQAYYLPPAQMTTLLVSNQALTGKYMPSNSQYQASQMQDPPRFALQPTQSQGNQTSQHQSMPTYQQQWSQQLPHSSVQPQMKVSSVSPYPSYLAIQQNPPSQEMVPNSASVQAPYLGASQSHASPQEVMSYGYGGTGAPVQDQAQPTQQHPKASDGYTLAPGNTYVIYDGEGGQLHHPTLTSQFSQGGYTQVIMPFQSPQPTPGPSPMIRPPQFIRNHPYNELIDKLVNMGYRGEHIAGAIQRLEESGHPVDFNIVLDRLNGHSSGSPHKGWSG